LFLNPTQSFKNSTRVYGLKQIYAYCHLNAGGCKRLNALFVARSFISAMIRKDSKADMLKQSDVHLSGSHRPAAGFAEAEEYEVRGFPRR